MSELSFRDAPARQAVVHFGDNTVNKLGAELELYYVDRVRSSS